MEAVCFSEIWVTTYQTTWCQIPHFHFNFIFTKTILTFYLKSTLQLLTEISMKYELNCNWSIYYTTWKYWSKSATKIRSECHEFVALLNLYIKYGKSLHHFCTWCEEWLFCFLIYNEKVITFQIQAHFKPILHKYFPICTKTKVLILKKSEWTFSKV
jgi:hypothetical protein